MYTMLIRRKDGGLRVGYMPSTDPLPDDVVIIIGECGSIETAELICKSREVFALAEAIVDVCLIGLRATDTFSWLARPSDN